MVILEQLLKFGKGTIPLIISVPHGGTIECKDIPKRSKGVLGIDKATIELAFKFIFYIEHISEKKYSIQKKPSYAISKLRRNNIDLNRKEEEAYDKNSNLAKKIYGFYHNKIREIINLNLKLYNRSLLIDIHGFDKNKRPAGYRNVELVLGTNNLKSITNIPVSKRDRNNNIRGKIIKKFLELKIPIAPAYPRRNEYVLIGGYTIQQYGAVQIPNSQAIQIEFSDRVRLYDKELKEKVL
ncbi:MAG: hypothetical protein ACFFAN_10585, partial [Promethearchaeota archaeon]